MNEISTEVKGLNIFQNLRIKLFLRRNLANLYVEKFLKQPEYIRNNYEVIRNIFENNKRLLNYIDANYLLQTLSIDELLAYSRYLSEDKKVELMGVKPDLIQTFGLEPIINTRSFYILNFGKVIDYLKENKSLLLKVIDNIDTTEKEDILKNMISSLNDKEIVEMTRFYKINIIERLEEKKQLDIIKENNELIRFASPDIQFDYIKNNPVYVKDAVFSVQKKFAELDVENNLKLTSSEFQIKLLQHTNDNFSFIFDNCAQDIKKRILDSQIEEQKVILSKLINENPDKYFKNVSDRMQIEMIRSNENLFEYASEKVKRIIAREENIASSIFESKWDNNRDEFFYDGTYGAKGSLLLNNSHNMFEMLDNWETGNIVRNMDINKFIELLKTDSNYIMPRVYDIKNTKFINEQDCQEIFRKMYGEDVSKQFENIISKIFEMQKEYDRTWVDKFGSGENRTIISKIPLQELKILFNEKIMTSNSFEDINNYFENVFNNKNSRQNFIKIMENTYGDIAKEILDSRIELDVHEINSLEIFDNRITDNFSKAFVNDLISYNFKYFSSFLNIVKQPEKLKLFKDYYKILSSTIGENAVTMQKAMSEFHNVENLLMNIDNIELTEKQTMNLLSVLCSEQNQFNIQTIEELESFNEIANNVLIDDIKEYKKVSINQSELRNRILKNLFGNIKDIYRYDISGELLKKEIWTEDERDILESILFMKKAPLEDVIVKCLAKENIRMPISLQSALEKARAHQLEIFNETFLTRDKMDTILSQIQRDGMTEEELSKLPLYKEEKDGIVYYHLNGIPFSLLHTRTDLGQTQKEFGLREYIYYEGQNSNNAICCQYANSKMKSCELVTGEMIYTSIPQDGIIGSGEVDIRTSHGNKEVEMTYQEGSESPNTFDIEKLGGTTYTYAEVSIYRRRREHDGRENEELGGRILPDFMVGELGNECVEENSDLLKKHNIPVLVYHFEKYRTLDKQFESKKKEKEENER